MKTTSKTLGTLMAVGILMGLGSTLSASILDVTYDFGTDPGKTTFADAGFAELSSNAGAVVVNVADGAQLTNTSGARHNVGFLRTFTGLGTTLTNNFTVTATLSYDTLATNANNNRPGGITLFASGTDLQTGINARIRQTSTAGSDSLELSTGLDVGTLASTPWDSDIAQGQDFTFTVVGTFDTVLDTLKLDFTATQGLTNKTVSHTVTDLGTLSGNYFGFAGRINDSVVTEVDTYSMNVIPEPSTLALLGIALGSLLFFRRRK